MEQQPGFVEVEQINAILKEPQVAGKNLLDLIASLRLARPDYRLTSHCLYLASIVAIQQGRTKDLNIYLNELLESGRAGLPLDVDRALPATLLQATEAFLSAGELTKSMGSFELMQRLGVTAEERTVALFLKQAMRVISQKQEHPRFEDSLLSFAQRLVLTVRVPSSRGWSTRSGACSANVKLLLAELERSMPRQLVVARDRPAFGSLNLRATPSSFGRAASRDWDAIGAARTA